MSAAGPRIALVGMPGSGKSSVGRQLARRLGLGFVDVDSAIEERLGCSIRDFFAAEGEAAFRDREAEVLAGLLAAPGGCVLATGGGAVLRPANRAALREHSTVIYLKTTVEELLRRLKGDQQRPLLQGVDPRAKLRELFAQRDPLYRETAHYVIETGRPSVATLVGMVQMQIEVAGLMPSRIPDEAAGPSPEVPA
ncbi:shikimate kinase [Aquariibacter albus]|nr:shikimate kinase [Aquariibacter albus]